MTFVIYMIGLGICHVRSEFDGPSWPNQTLYQKEIRKRDEIKVQFKEKKITIQKTNKENKTKSK